MRKYSFRLDNVRRVRRVQEGMAKSDLLGANTEVQRAIDIAEERMGTYEGKVAQRPTGAVGVEAFMRQRYFNELAGKAVVAARASQAAAEAEAAIKREAFTEAARKVKALDRLDEKGRDEYRIEADRALDAEMDEIVTSRFRPGVAS